MFMHNFPQQITDLFMKLHTIDFMLVRVTSEV